MTQNSAKIALRSKIKSLMQLMSPESRILQSKNITQKLLAMPVYKKAKRISIYLSTDMEVSTMGILKHMFHDLKEVFVPTYKGDVMEMVKIYSIEDYNTLPVTKWNIKQPSLNDNRENPMLTYPLDLILLPGVAFTKTGGRCGHGRGYYDKYLDRYFKKYPQKALNNNDKTILIGLAFNEQVIDCDKLPLDPYDYPLDLVLTND